MIGRWNRSGACEWRVDEAGALTVRPAGGAPEGELGEAQPWEALAGSIRSATFEGRVVAPSEWGSHEGMFEECSLLESVDLSGLDTSQVTDMSRMFSGCSSLEEVDLSFLDTSKVRIMGVKSDGDGMFSSCSSLRSVILSGLDTSNVTSMTAMFWGCSSLREVALGERFSFEGAGSERLCELPGRHGLGQGLTGRWTSSADGVAYEPGNVPSNVAAAYAA